MPSIKGTASIASNAAQTKLLRSTKFPSSFASPVDLTKVNATVMAQWIEKKIESILGFEDEIVSSMAINLFFPKLNEDFGSTSSSGPVSSIKYAPVDPRKSQLDLVGFLGEEDAARFSCELWEMLIDAQNQPRGIPQKLIEEKKKELAAAAATVATTTTTKTTNASTLSSDRRGRRDKRCEFHGRRRHPTGSNYGQNTTHDIRPSSQMHPELGRPKRTTTSTGHAAVIERSDATGGGPSARSNYESRGGQYYDTGKDRFRGEYYYSNKDYDSYPDRFSRRSFAGGSSSTDGGGGGPVRERDWRSHYPGGGYRSSSSRYDETYPSDHSSADSYGRRRRRYGEPSSSRSSHRRRRSDRFYYDDDDRRQRRRRKSLSLSRSVSRSRSKERYQGRDGSHEYNRKRSSRSRSKSPNNNKYSSNGRSFRR
jgi:Protein involved in mRNA turnover and stability